MLRVWVQRCLVAKFRGYVDPDAAGKVNSEAEELRGVTADGGGGVPKNPVRVVEGVLCPTATKKGESKN